MEMTKDKLRETQRFHRVDPDELEDIAEWAEYLDAILCEPCTIYEEDDGELVLLDIKAVVDSINGLKLEIYPNEHPPPHFHVKSATVNASFKIDDGELLHGKILRANYKKIQFWHKRSKSLLIEIWDSTRPTECQVGPYREPS